VGVGMVGSAGGGLLSGREVRRYSRGSFLQPVILLSDVSWNLDGDA